jgi:hypothetical protein
MRLFEVSHRVREVSNASPTKIGINAREENDE